LINTWTVGKYLEGLPGPAYNKGQHNKYTINPISRRGHNRYFAPGFWIRIGSGFSGFVDPARGKKMKKFQWKNALVRFCFSLDPYPEPDPELYPDQD
jgi:hypothetical protein